MSDILTEGKTKYICKGEEPGTVFLRMKDRLTAGDAAKVVELEGISKFKTTQTANVFRYLNRRGLPTAFLDQTGPTEILCKECSMVPLEIVSRRYAWGSFLKRNLHFPRDRGHLFRFVTPVTEIFHKFSIVMPPLVEVPTLMSESEARDRFMVNQKWEGEVITDPLCATYNNYWGLYRPKQPSVDDSYVSVMRIVPVLTEEATTRVRELAISCFVELENAWNEVAGYLEKDSFSTLNLVDMKIEIGMDSDGNLLIADVIDNDSWRLWPDEDPALQLDKQVFRDGGSLVDVANNYELVAKLTEKFNEV